jgi:N-acetylglucosamine kinase-like BadF-type ATPase
VNAIGIAAEKATAGVTGSERPATALLAMAGEKTAAFRQQVSGRLAALGVGEVVLEHDLLGMFHSGTAALDGYALIAGTGTVAARIRRGQLDRVVGGKGWLLGDAGGGFWIGHAVTRAVVASLDGQGPDTALTDLMLEALGIRGETENRSEREEILRQLVSVLYARPPISLADFAPLAFAAYEDPVARPILIGAAAALANLLAAVRAPDLLSLVEASSSAACWPRHPASEPTCSIRQAGTRSFRFRTVWWVRPYWSSGMQAGTLTRRFSVGSRPRLHVSAGPMVMCAEPVEARPSTAQGACSHRQQIAVDHL